MKKSKFLKKSLSLLIALLLIVTMIPVGTFAATVAPAFVEFKVEDGANWKSASISGNTMTVIAANANLQGTLNVSYVTKSIGEPVEVFYGKDNTAIVNPNPGSSSVTAAIDVSKYTTDGTATVDMTVRSVADHSNSTTYRLIIENKIIKDDNAIEMFQIKDQISSTFQKGLTKFEVVLPYGTDLDSTVIGPATSIALSDKKATHDWNSVMSTIGASKDLSSWERVKLTVTSQNNVKQVYEITIRRAHGISSFRIPGQIGPTTGKNGTSSTADYMIQQPDFSAGAIQPGIIHMYVPRYWDAYDTVNTKLNLIPEFTSENNDAKVEIVGANVNASGRATVVSGVTEVNLFDAIGGNARVEVTYPNAVNGKVAVYKLEFEQQTSSDLALIKSFKVADSKNAGIVVDGKVNGDELTAEVSSNVDLTKVTLKLMVSTNGTIVPASDVVKINGATTQTVIPGVKEFTEVEVRNVNAENDVAVMVTSESGKVKTYRLKITTKEAPDTTPTAKFTSMYIRNTDTNVEYKALETAGGLNEVGITFKVPASFSATDLAKMNLYYAAPAGLSLEYKTGATTWAALPTSSSKIESTDIGVNKVLPSPDVDKQTTTIRVTAFDKYGFEAGHTEYIVKFEKEDWKLGTTLKDGAFKVTNANTTNLPKTADNTFVAKNAKNTLPGGYPSGPHAGTSIVNTLKIEVPAYHYEDMAGYGRSITGSPHTPKTKLKATDLDLPEGSVLYVEDENFASASIKRVYTLEEKDDDVTNVTFDIDKSNITAGGDQVRLFVFNEKAHYELDKKPGNNGTIPNFLNAPGRNQDVSAAHNAHKANYSVYYIDFVEAPERTAFELKKISLIDADRKKIDGTIVGSTIKFNVPYSWAKANLSAAVPAAAEKELYFDYEAAPGNVLSVMSGAAPVSIIPGAFRDEDDKPFDVTHGNAEIYIGSDGKAKVFHDKVATNYTPFTKLNLATERGAKERDYQVEFKVNPVRGESLITDFSLKGVKGVINGRTITVTLPYMAKLDALVPTFKASEMATVFFGSTNSEVLSDKTSLDFRSPVSLTVKSEENLSSTVYTVKVETPLKFTDVPADSWFYKEVIEAAQLKIIGGKGDGTFGPMESVKRGDFVIMLANACKIDFAEAPWRYMYTTNPFRDVDIDSYYGKAVAWAASEGYVNGFADSNFKPNDPITRQEAATIFKKVRKLAEVTNPTKPYADDAKIAPWAKGFVYACQTDGILVGNAKGEFGPHDKITRAQAAIAMTRYYHK